MRYLLQRTHHFRNIRVSGQGWQKRSNHSDLGRTKNFPFAVKVLNIQQFGQTNNCLVEVFLKWSDQSYTPSAIPGVYSCCFSSRLVFSGDEQSSINTMTTAAFVFHTVNFMSSSIPSAPANGVFYGEPLAKKLKCYVMLQFHTLFSENFM